MIVLVTLLLWPNGEIHRYEDRYSDRSSCEAAADRVRDTVVDVWCEVSDAD